MSEPLSIERARGAVILCCGSPCPCDAIESELARQELFVLRLPEPDERYRHDADAAAARILEARSTLPADKPVAYIGASVSGAGALIAAAQRPAGVVAVVSINGRTDFAVESMREVHTPSLLIVNDMPVLRMNREALSQLHVERRLEVVHGEDATALDHIVERAVRWTSERLALVPAAV